MHYAHEQRLVHRALSPQSILVIDPTAAQVEQSIATLPADRLADLVYWAGLSNVQFTPALVKALKDAVDLPLHLHSHSTAGLADMRHL